MIRVLIDTTPLTNGNAHRGVGQYTQLLTEALQHQPQLSIRRSDQTDTGTQGLPADVIHYPFFDLFFPTLPLLRPAKTVVTIHDVIPLLYPAQYQPGKRGKLMFWRQVIALRTVQAIITDSQASAHDIERLLYVPASKITVVPLAANPALQPAKPAQIKAARERWHLPATYLLYVGDINYNKNLPQLIKALKFLPETVHLVCVGKNFYPQDIPEWRWIEAQVTASEVGERVKFITDVASDELEALAALYTGAAVYVQPSVYEGFGLPVLEAMQCQVPVVASQNSSLVETGGDFAVFSDSTAEALAATIEPILAWSEAKRQRWVAAAAVWANHFSWTKTAAATAAVYKRLMAR